MWVQKLSYNKILPYCVFKTEFSYENQLDCWYQNKEYTKEMYITISFCREIQAIFTCYLGSLLTGYGLAFSAIAIPDIKNDRDSQFSFLGLGLIQISNDSLAWFGKTSIYEQGRLFKHCFQQVQ